MAIVIKTIHSALIESSRISEENSAVLAVAKFNNQ